MLVVVFFYTYDALIGIYRPYSPKTNLHLEYPELGLEWKMYPVDNPGDWLPNGLDTVDVNDDGFADYVQID